MSEIIKVENVSKVYRVNKRREGFISVIANLVAPKFEKKVAVNNISFSINKGEAVAFIGSNGAGKSTTIKMLSGILYPSEGKIKVNGYVPYKQRKQYVSEIGVVLGQKSQLVWDLPVLDSYELIRHIYRIPKKDYEKRLAEFIELLDMEGFVYQPVRQLSLGQKMRAEIVAAMLHAPKIVFLDEPTIGLDLVAKKKIQEFVKKINKDYNVTIIFTTHDLQDIVSTCERLIIIDKGKKIYDGAVRNVKDLCDEVKSLRLELEEGTEVEKNELLTIKKKDKSSVEISFAKDEIQVEKIKNYINNRYNVSSIKPVEGSSNEIRVILKDEKKIDDTLIYKCEKLAEKEYKVIINDLNSQIGATLQYFVSNYDIKDVLVKEPDISEIVYNIYEGKVAL